MEAVLDTAATESLLIAALRAEPYSFDFFQAVRLLALAQPSRAQVGTFAHPRNEVARFGAHPSLSFPASQIQSMDWKEGKQPSLTVNFMGLIGPLGVLPKYYTELAIERTRAHDRTLRDFLDLFHHRIISLFYQAWEKHKFGVGYERHGKDPLSERLLDLVGLGTAGLQNRQKVRDETILFYSGFYGRIARSAIGLESVIGDYFDVPVEVEQFVGVWRSLDTDDQCCLDAGSTESGQLGWGAVVGDEVWDRQSRVRIKIGPLPAETYLDFLPNGTAYQPLNALAKAFCGNDLEFEVQLSLRREEVPGCELGREGVSAPQLGWFTWLKSKPGFGRDPSDTILLLN